MKNNETIETNWCVITGGPSTGKTTAINMLTERGYKTTIEHARHYIDTMRVKGQSVEELRSNKREFQLGVLDMQIEQEASINPKDLVFLDRAIPDALAYYRFLRLEVDEILKETDKYTIPDWPHSTPESKQAWLDYRQALRDLPTNTTDLENPVWPSPPE